jgi:hypothetical protein
MKLVGSGERGAKGTVLRFSKDYTFSRQFGDQNIPDNALEEQELFTPNSPLPTPRSQLNKCTDLPQFHKTLIKSES